jgi:hypothetical protein
VLPSQDQLVQIVISELHSKHSIDLHPASGITAAVSNDVVALFVFLKKRIAAAMVPIPRMFSNR